MIVSSQYRSSLDFRTGTKNGLLDYFDPNFAILSIWGAPSGQCVIKRPVCVSGFFALKTR